MEKDTNKWKDISCSWIVKTPLLLKAIYRLKAISIKIPVAHFIKLEQITLKFICNLGPLEFCNQSPHETTPPNRSWQLPHKAVPGDEPIVGQTRLTDTPHSQSATKR